MKHIICFSGGHSSALVAIEVARRYGAVNVVLLNHDISEQMEAADIKRFKREIARYLGLPITYANVRALPLEQLPNQFDVCLEKSGYKAANTGDAFCTYVLKTVPFNRYLAENFPLQDAGSDQEQTNKDCIIYYGFDEDEQHRISRRSGILAAAGYQTEYPLANWPSTIENTEEIGIARPNTYSVYIHGNCKGCLKGGIQHWYVTFVNEPAVFYLGVKSEADMLAKTGKPYTILRDRRAGKFGAPLPLTALVPVFELMLAEGVPATEHLPTGKFKALLKRYRLTSDAAEAEGLEEEVAGISCECFNLNEKPATV